jgi:class 3 adenylate cyclase
VKPRIPLYLKITAASFFVVLVVLGFVGLIQYRDQRRGLEDKFGLTLSHVAQTAALFLDGAAHSRVHANADATGADFQKLRDVLERVRRENSLKEDALYTLRPTDNGKLEFVVMLQQKTFVGDQFTPAPEAARVSQWVLADGQARYTHIYTDQYGSFVSGFAPVRDGDKVVGLLEVDYGVDRFLAELSVERRKQLWIIPASLLLALVLSIGVAISITGAVKRLVDGTAAVQSGHYDRPVEVRTRDELRTLAESFNVMLGGLRERFAMLKFVPRHTRAVIADAVKGSGGVTGQLSAVAQVRDVAILFSDIRGFTSISDKLGPARVIEMLNIYLRAEAEIIERNSGSIDKFIGDAVMAVFEGPERFANAARAAVEIQGAMRTLNERRAFDQPVEVGVGIAGGEVVMGSVGYEDRLEFAVIGRLVNLASRLTAVAGRGEIVVSEQAHEALGERYAVERLEGLKLKGFADAITCYKLKPVEDPPTSANSAA